MSLLMTQVADNSNPEQRQVEDGSSMVSQAEASNEDREARRKGHLEAI